MALTITSCGRKEDKEDLGLQHLQEKYPDYTFTYSNYADGRAYYDVEGFEDRTIVRVGQEDPLILYDNFPYIRYGEQIRDREAEILSEIASRFGAEDFNMACYGYAAWMRDGELTSFHNMTAQTAMPRNTEDLSFDEFMASPDSCNELIGVFYLEDAADIDIEEAEQIISEVIEESGCVFFVVRIDFTDNYDEFASTGDSRWVVYDYRLRLMAETDEEGHLTDCTWREN